MTFSSTRSGLTRFEFHSREDDSTDSTPESSEESPAEGKDEELDKEAPFHEVHVKATDEVFYKRAVDFSRINASAFVYSVPSDAGERLQYKDITVTASRAIYAGNGKQRAPVAVVGLLFNHKLFAERYFNHTTKCGSKDCKVKCSDETTHCLLVDNNGYIIVSEKKKFIGKLLSEFDNNVMESLVSNKVLIRKKIYDWQAVCIDVYQVSGPASFLTTPFDMIRRIIVWFWARLSMMALDIYLNGFFDTVLAFQEEAKTTDESPTVESSQESGHGAGPIDETRKMINKTRPRPCVKELDLFDINPKWIDSDQVSVAKNKKCTSNSGCDQ